MQRDWLFIGNPHAGAARTPKLWSQLTRQFLDAATLDVRWTRAPGEGADLARSAAGQCSMVVAVGGDGTVNEVATGLIEAQPQTKVQVDGDVCGSTPARFQVFPRLLRVCVPCG